METVDLVRSKITEFVMADPNHNRGFEFRMSTAGDCQRKLEYDSQLGKEKVSIDVALRLETGEPYHDYWREKLTKIFPNDFMYAEDELTISFEVDGETLRIPGHPDGYIKSLDSIVEVKSVSDSTYQMVVGQQAPLSAHLAQGNIYAEAVGASRILFIYYNRNSGQYSLFLAAYSHELSQATCQKWAQVYRNRKVGVISARPYHDATCSPCFFCNWRAKCYEGFKEEISKFNPAVSADPELLQMANRYSLSRELRLTHDKLETEVKAEIAMWMIDSKASSVRVEGVGDLHLAIGKNNNPLISIKPLKEVP